MFRIPVSVIYPMLVLSGIVYAHAALHWGPVLTIGVYLMIYGVLLVAVSVFRGGVSR